MFLDDIYTVLQKENETVYVAFCDETHPVFQAHFPCNPILPGFVHLEIITVVFNLEINKIKRAKFLDAVLPSQHIKYVKSHNKYTVLRDGNLVASFILE